MRKLIVITAALALISSTSAAIAASKGGGGKNPQISTQQTAPATAARKPLGIFKRTHDKREAGSENIHR